MKQIISHLYTDNSGNWVIQSNDEHSMGVAKLASQFAGEFGMSEYGKVLGLLHDKGKETDAFQRYIKSESGYIIAKTKCAFFQNEMCIFCVFFRGFPARS